MSAAPLSSSSAASQLRLGSLLLARWRRSSRVWAKVVRCSRRCV